MASHADVRFRMWMDGWDPDTFRVLGFAGEEAMSALYRFDVTLVAESPDLDLRALLGCGGHLSLSTFGQDRAVHGRIVEARYVGERPGAGSLYRVRLMPRLWRLSRTRRNRICGTETPVSVDEIVRADLEAIGLTGTSGDDASQVDYRLDLHGTYPARDYVVQYDETDLAFVSRLMEARGIWYLFEAAETKEVVVVADTDTAFGDVPDAAELAFGKAGGMIHGEPTVLSADISRRLLPTRLILKDYNYRLPHVAMAAEADVDPSGHGVVVRHGDHFRTPEEGADLAAIRAAALLCRRETLTATSDCVGVAPGRRFRLTHHPSASCDERRFLVERVVHEGWDSSIPGPPPAGLGLIGAGTAGYANRIEALDAALPYRPEERTPKPRSPSVLSAHIDGAGDGLRAELDEAGRYKAKMEFDPSPLGDGNASRAIRRMQPYGGSSQGLHFPLLKGTEVLAGSMGGDFDRPIILGAVPNPAQPSQVKAANSERNVLRTTAGVLLEINDGTVGSDDSAAGDSVSGGVYTDSVTSSGSWAKLYVPDYDGTPSSGTDSYLRLGISDTSSESGYVSALATAAGLDSVDGVEDGILAYTSGNETRVTHGSRADSVGGDAYRVVTGSVTESIAGSRTTTIGYEDSTSPGNDSLSVTGNQDLVVDGDYAESVSGSHSVSVGGDYGRTVGGDYLDTVDGDYDRKATDGYALVVQGDYTETVNSHGVWTIEGVQVGTTVGAFLGLYHGSVHDSAVSIRIHIMVAGEIFIAGMHKETRVLHANLATLYYNYRSVHVRLGIIQDLTTFKIKDYMVEAESGTVDVQEAIDVSA